jgi:membrane protein required for colicin V production
VLVDAAIVLLLVGAVLLGIFRGAIRQLICLGAWLVAFIVAAHARPPIVDWLIGQEPDFSRQYAEMVALVLAFVVLFGLAVIVIQVGGRTVQLSSRPLVDEVVGAVVMLFVGLLAIASLQVALGTYYGATPEAPTQEMEALRTLYVELERSAIANAVGDTLTPAIKTLLGPLLPADVHSPG